MIPNKLDCVGYTRPDGGRIACYGLRQSMCYVGHTKEPTHAQ